MQRGKCYASSVCLVRVLLTLWLVGVYIYTYIHIYIYTYIHIYIYTYIHTYKHELSDLWDICMQRGKCRASSVCLERVLLTLWLVGAYMYTYIHVYIYINMNSQLFKTYVCRLVHTYIHIYIYAYIQIWILGVSTGYISSQALLEAGSKGSKREGGRRCLLRLGLRGVREREAEGAF